MYELNGRSVNGIRFTIQWAKDNSSGGGRSERREGGDRFAGGDRPKGGSFSCYKCGKEVNYMHMRR